MAQGKADGTGGDTAGQQGEAGSAAGTGDHRERGVQEQ